MTGTYYRNSTPNYYRPSFFGGFQYFPPVIKTLLISNVAVTAVMWMASYFRLQGYPLAEVGETLFALFPLGRGFYPWQLFTYMFLHAGAMHLLFNMLALWMFGMQLENAWGSKKFLLYYLLCGVGAGLSNLLIGPLFGPAGPTVGASGAIYGVLLAFGMTFPDQPIFIYFLLPIRARYFVLLYIGWELVLGVTGTADGVAHFAHLGGAAVGLVYMLIDRRKLPAFERRRHVQSEPVGSYSQERVHISDAKFFEVHDEEERVNQAKIDEILDKISQHGYQSLTDQEKKVLFEASKKLN